MKKLSLKLEGIGKMLTKEQMRRVLGGYAGEDCIPGGEGCSQVIEDDNCCSGYTCRDYAHQGHGKCIPV